MFRYYLHAEAFNLNSIVYDTNDISTIRGGSFMLRDAVLELPSVLPQLQRIASAASKGVFSYEDDGDLAAQRAVMVPRVLKALDEATGGHATFAVAVEADEGDFALTLARLEAGVRRQQWRLPTVRPPAFEPAEQECFIDGWRPGVGPYNVDKTVKDAKISRATDYRRQEGRRLRHKIFHEVLMTEDSEDDLCPVDLGMLAGNLAKGILDGKMALLHVDGNGFGRIRAAHCHTPKQRSEFDEVVQDAREKFLAGLRSAARDDDDFLIRLANGRKIMRLEILLWGGDEFTLIAPAWKGLEVLERFYRATAGLEFAGVPLTHRSALIFAHHNAPILQIRRLADDLLDIVKDETKRAPFAPGASAPAAPQLAPPQSGSGNAARYLVLESFDMLRGPLDRFLARYYGPANSAGLLLNAATLASVRADLQAIRAVASKGHVIEIAHALAREKPGCAAALEKRFFADLPPGAVSQVRAALAGLSADPNAAWFLLADLWDYAEDWSA